MRSYLAWLLPLAALWGASYLFIRVGVRELAPATMVLVRVALAALLLVLVLWRRGDLGELQRAPLAAYALGVANAALPFTLIAWGERRVDSGVAAIANASMPIFVALIAIRYRCDERATGVRAAGVVLGFVGVGVVTGAAPSGGWRGVAGVVAVLVASVSYAVAALWGQRLTDTVRGPVLSTASLIGAAVALLPLGIAQAPSRLPSLKAAGCVLALAVGGTAVGQLLWFGLLRRFGSSRASLVSYLLPVTALFYGALILHERVTLGALGGLVLILGGVALGSGALGAVRRGAAAPTT